MASTFHFCVLQAITWRKYNMHVNRNEWIVDLFLIMFSNFHISDSWIWNYCSRGIGKMETLREDVIQNAIKFLWDPTELIDNGFRWRIWEYSSFICRDNVTFLLARCRLHCIKQANCCATTFKLNSRVLATIYEEIFLCQDWKFGWHQKQFATKTISRIALLIVPLKWFGIFLTIIGS